VRILSDLHSHSQASHGTTPAGAAALCALDGAVTLNILAVRSDTYASGSFDDIDSFDELDAGGVGFGDSGDSSRRLSANVVIHSVVEVRIKAV